MTENGSKRSAQDDIGSTVTAGEGEQALQIRVECYAGYRADQEVRRFYLGPRCLEISRIIDRWAGPDHRYFKVEVDGGDIYILRQNTVHDFWELTFYRQTRGQQDSTREPMGGEVTIDKVPLCTDEVDGRLTPPRGAPDSGGAPVTSHIGSAWATLIGGVFGDPLLHLRLRHLRQSYFFDLGDPARLASRVAHQVRAVFISHAHIDHICGFLWFLRSRIGHFEPCRIYGPAETISRIESFIDAITWDRIGENGPVFEVCEFDGEQVRCAMLQPGKARIDLPELAIEDGILIEEESFVIRGVVCDHGIPSVAYGFNSRKEVNVRKERLVALGLAPGLWLGRLKECVYAQTPEVEIELPNGTSRRAGGLADELVIVRPGKKLVYAADMADTPENREKLIELAEDAHTLFCETAFTGADREKARVTQHLTTQAAMEISRAARVERLAPFHFSRRYEHDSGEVYGELLEMAGGIKILGLPSRSV